MALLIGPPPTLECKTDWCRQPIAGYVAYWDSRGVPMGVPPEPVAPRRPPPPAETGCYSWEWLDGEPYVQTQYGLKPLEAIEDIAAEARDGPDARYCD